MRKINIKAIIISSVFCALGMCSAVFANTKVAATSDVLPLGRKTRVYNIIKSGTLTYNGEDYGVRFYEIPFQLKQDSVIHLKITANGKPAGKQAVIMQYIGMADKGAQVIDFNGISEFSVLTASNVFEGTYVLVKGSYVIHLAHNNKTESLTFSTNVTNAGPYNYSPQSSPKTLTIDQFSNRRCITNYLKNGREKQWLSHKATWYKISVSKNTVLKLKNLISGGNFLEYDLRLGKSTASPYSKGTIYQNQTGILSLRKGTNFIHIFSIMANGGIKFQLSL